jgi:hypothetical protein
VSKTKIHIKVVTIFCVVLKCGLLLWQTDINYMCLKVKCPGKYFNLIGVRKWAVENIT